MEHTPPITLLDTRQSNRVLRTVGRPSPPTATIYRKHDYASNQSYNANVKEQIDDIDYPYVIIIK